MNVRTTTLTLALFVFMMGSSILRADDAAGPGKVAPTNGPAGSVYGPIAYDPSGNIMTVGSDSGVSNDYIYDPVGRIVAAAVQRSGNLQSQGYGYDAYGNRIAVTGVNALNYSVEATTNRLGSGSPHYAQYDSVGNMTTWLPPGSVASREYTYDALNMVTKESAAGPAGTQTVYHIYTADDERYWSLHVLPDGSNRSDYTIRNLGGQVLRDYLEGPSGFSIEHDYVYRDGQLLGAVTATGNHHYTLDHLGTPRIVTDQSAAKLAEHTYYPFGVELTDGSPTDGLLKYTGHERDPDLLGEAAGVTDYMHARYYASGMGRFLSVDPARSAKLTQPQAWNWYGYSRNNPLNMVDPNGNEAVEARVAAEWNRAMTFLSGLGRGMVDTLGWGTRPTDTAQSQRPEFEAGRMLGYLFGTHDFVADASVTVDPGIGNDITIGAAVVNGTDFYVFIGGGYSYSFSPVSGTMSVGVVENYQGPGSYGGTTTGVTPQPAGVAFSANPTNPQSTVTMSLSFSSDIGVTQNVTYTVAVSSLPKHVQAKLKKGGYVIVQGELYRLVPKG